MSLSSFSGLFDQPDAWRVFASGQARGTLSAIDGPEGRPGIALDYDFHGGGGFVVIRRELPFAMPDTFEIGFLLRGYGPRNHFEFKVASPGGANVWRHLCQDFDLPDSWTPHLFNERGLPFAWGPAGGGAPSEVEAVEIVIAAGPGGNGRLELSAAFLDDQRLLKPASVTASGYLTGYAPELAMDAGATSGWRADPGEPSPWWQVDFGRKQRFGGIVIRWPDDLPARVFDMEISDDGQSWSPIHQATHALGKLTHISTPNAETRHLRLSFQNAGCAAIQCLSLKPDAFSSTPNEFIHAVARDYPRGWHPRYWHREQSYWTPVGSPEGKRRALINEEGLVEVDEAGFSLEPFILTNKGLLSWAEAEVSISLEKNGMPLPRVRWKTKTLMLDILPWVDGRDDELILRVTYRLRRRASSTPVKLVVAARPFQVDPPWQAFRNLGGISPIHRVSADEDGLTVEGRTVSASPKPALTGTAMFEEGCVPRFLAEATVPDRKETHDPTGLASGLMTWSLPEGDEMLEVTVSVPYHQIHTPPDSNDRHNALNRWKRKLGAVRWDVPKCAQAAFDCWRTTAAHILINRDGPAIQPGPRRYTRSWVRDCVIMGAALAKAGLHSPLHEFIEWYAGFQREDGFIPCVVDRDGVDWLVEHDSHGQFLWGVREVHRANPDPRFLERLMSHVGLAVEYLLELRKQRFGPEYESGEKAAMRGLLPESASHEGYLAHPVHSYWDDFWGIRGLQAAADLAKVAGLTDDAARWATEADYFQDDVLRSIEKVIADKQLAYVPGSVEWADFDPTATSNAIAMLDFADALPQAALDSMLATYLDGFHRKHRGEMPWNNYTAYEIRIIGAFVRLGKRETANELLDFFLSDRRPLPWNQWPEITWKDLRAPGHLGDVPHTWIAAEYLLALTSMVVEEREASATIILAGGMRWEWIAEDNGFSVKNLPTRFGKLDFMIRAEEDGTLSVHVGGKMHPHFTGIFIQPPLPEGKRIVNATNAIGDCVIEDDGTGVSVLRLPFESRLMLGAWDFQGHMGRRRSEPE